MALEDSLLGKKVNYNNAYNPQLLCVIDRASKRSELGLSEDLLPFYGFDSWNHYEVSCLNSKGKPLVAIAQIRYDCHSPCIVESKSLKLYFNSLNNTKFADLTALSALIKKDLDCALDTDVSVQLHSLGSIAPTYIKNNFEGTCIDTLDIDCDAYTVEPSILNTQEQYVEEQLYSNLLRSNCLITNQPDWGSVFIKYKGRKINHAALLKYIISFRNHNEFHEQCIERIFVDIMHCCKPSHLTLYGRYTRRGGLDINPLRATHKCDYKDFDYRLVRQ